MLNSLNRRLQKMMPIITPSGVILGIISAYWLHHLAFLVPWIFAFMTFAGSLGSGLRDLLKTLSRPYHIIVILFILHLVMPLLAYALATWLFHGDGYLITGIVLGMVVPGAITSFIWTSIYRGNLTLTLSVVLLDTLLSPYIVPHSLAMLVGTKVQMDTWAMSKGLFWMIVVPSLLGMLWNHFSKGKVTETLAPALSPFSKICLGLVVAINSSVVAGYLKPITWRLVTITAIVFVIAAIGYMVGFLAAKVFRWDRNSVVAATFGCGMRNISSGAVIALAYFPPPVSVPVILSMLFQQVLASFYGILLSRYAAERTGNSQLSKHAVP